MPSQSRNSEDVTGLRVVSRFHKWIESKEIESVEEWRRYCTRKRQWKERRSAAELAHSFFRTGYASLPREIDSLMKTHPETASVRLRICEPEMITQLDNFRGGHRNHDAVLLDDEESPTSLMSIEAKVDEPFGDIISKRLVGASPNAQTRIHQLSMALFGRFDTGIAEHRYQLVHAISGTLIEAGRCGASQAIFVVYEFVSLTSSERARERSGEDLAKFLNCFRVSAGGDQKPGTLLGPLAVNGDGFVPGDMPVFVGKAIHVPRR